MRLTTGRLRTLLVGLAMSAGRAVSVDQLTRIVWADDLPADPRRSLQTYAARLRRAVGGRCIETVRAGWLLHADPDDVDALRFERLLDAATRAPDPVAERDLLVQALSLWRGEPFDGEESSWLREAERPRLLERYLAARERRIDLDIRDGVAAESLIAELETLTGRYPLRESLWVRLMTLLDGRGRPAEALRRYEIVRERIADELGIDPSLELRALYARLLAGKPANGPQWHIPFPVVPRQLPPELPGFAGRRDALATLDKLLAARRAEKGSGVAVVTGIAGVGKTTLVLRWAQRTATNFPDGQLYCDLRGFDSQADPVTPHQAIHGFLVGLGVALRNIPVDVDDRAAMYRSLTAGKRLLVVLDNARSAKQVRPLLTSGPGGFVVVTSRNRLNGLVVSGGAQPVPLGLMPAQEARELLHNRVRLLGIRHDLVAVDEIVRWCAGLPLALAITAARLATGPEPPLAAVTSGLRDPRSRLDLLDDGDEASSVRAAFSRSYRAVSREATRLFRLAGLQPGPEVSLLTTASLAGMPVRHARQRFAELTDMHLMVETAPGRYALNDLLRIYAREQAEEHGV
ncbi:winged helix-turn-helix domain-containing protein [Micromonospora sp. CPCC 205371]|nr:winged helix-turn-helix domain-containing protein [Micromonospora sp. CPCC 205371]